MAHEPHGDLVGSQARKLFEAALALHRKGEPSGAQDLYRQCLAHAPGHFGALHMLGLSCMQLGDPRSAAAWIARALEIDPASADAHCNLGTAFKDIGRFEEADLHFRRAAELRPGFALAHSNRGDMLRTTGRLDEALECCEQAVQARPDMAAAHINLGNVLNDLGRTQEALASYDRALELKPASAGAHYNRADALRSLGRPDEALASYDRAIELRPTFAEAHSNRGNALQDLQRLDDALASYLRAAQLRPDYPEAHHNAAAVLRELGLVEEAAARFRHARELRPDYADALLNEALTLLLMGDYARGLPLYEYRWDKPGVKRLRRKFAQPLWVGQADLAGKTVLLHAEQGLGDTIQFCRYARMVQARGARVVMETPRALGPLLTGLAGVDAWVPTGQPLPAFDLHCPLLSLPLALGTRADSIPAPVPYLHAQPERVARWAQRLGASGFRIGICWQGSTQAVDAGRSFAVTHFEGLSQVPGVRLISLHRGAGEAQLAHLPPSMRVEQLGDELDRDGAFLDTAAVIMHCHLVITSDTAVAHLAGALGAPVWLALKHVPEWRWMLQREDSPWYPTMRLFRQHTRGDWPEVFERIEAEARLL
jgi:tetratricopeptide (TPR) repeat protein